MKFEVLRLSVETTQIENMKVWETEINPFWVVMKMIKNCCNLLKKLERSIIPKCSFEEFEKEEFWTFFIKTQKDPLLNSEIIIT